MKQLHLFFGLLLLVCISTNVKAQQIDSFIAYGSCTQIGDTPMANYNITLSAIPTGTTVKIYYGDGNSNTITPTSKFIWDTHKFASEGTYTVKAVTYNGTTAVDSTTRTLRIHCSSAIINVYYDATSDCIKQLFEWHVTSKTLVEVKESGIVIDTLDVWGCRYYELKKSTPYIFRILNTPVGTSATCPSTGQISFTTPAFKTNQTLDFGMQCGTTSQYDLAVDVWGQFRPVSFSYIHVYPRNIALCGSTGGIVTLNISPKYSYSSATITPTSVSGNTITWNLTAVQLLSFTSIRVTVNPATTVALGDTVCNTASISPTSGDVNLINNTDYTCNTVASSFDPNEKSVYPQGNFKQGDVFTYRIDFENLGNDTAFNIHVLDTLSTYLNENSIEILNSSHAMSHSILTAGTKKILKFDFPNILLPDSNDKLHNKGYVEFRIATKTSGIPSGTVLSNRAGIYFDVNPVVMTNSAYRRLAPVSVNEVNTTEEIQVYPNPANDVLYINMADNHYQHASVMNSVGQELKHVSVSKGNNTVDIKQLIPGIYQLLLKGENGTKAIKFQKL